jgi:hypothetical protein
MARPGFAERMLGEFGCSTETVGGWVCALGDFHDAERAAFLLDESEDGGCRP